MTDHILADLTGEQMAAELAALRQRVAELETAASAEQAEKGPHLEAILQELADAVIITDQNSVIQTWNRAAEEMYGWTAAEAIGRSMSELAPSEYAHEDPAAVYATFDALGRWRGEAIQRRKDGRRIHVDATVSRLPGGADGGRLVLAINRDISARREAEAEHRAFFGANVSPAFWVELPEPVSLDLSLDEQLAAVLRTGRITEANDACARVFGLADHTQLQGLALADLCDASTFGPDGALRQMAEAFARAGHAIQGYELSVKGRGDAPARWFECSLQGVVEDGALQRIWGSATDITARVQAERDMHENELRYQALRRLSNDFIFLHALDDDGGVGHFVEVNEVACRRLGYTQEEMRRFGPLDILINADAAKVHSIIDRIMQDGAFTFERELRPRQGEPIPVELHSRVFDYQGQRLVLTVARDLSPQRQAEQALRESEARFAAMFEASPGAMALTRRDDDRLADVNRAWEELTGYTHSEAVGRTSLELGVWLDPAQREQVIARLGEQAVASLEMWARHKAGQVRELLMSATTVTLGDEPYLLTMAQDITELRRAQEALREERDRAQSYLDIAAVMLISFDLKGRVTLINNRGCEVLGRSEEELLGKDWIETCLPEQERDKVRLLFARLMRGGGSYVEYRENVVLTASGRLRTIAWRNTVLRDARGRVTGLLSSGEDITERRQAERALQDSEARLRAIYESIPVATYTWRAVDDDFELMDYNVAAYEATQGQIERLVGARASDFYRHAPGIRADLERCLAEKSIIEREMDYEFRTTGERHQMHVRYYFAAPDMVLVHADDITELRQAQDELRRERDRAQSYLDIAAVMLVGLDLDNRITLINKKGCEVLGRTEEELIGRDWIEACVPPSGRGKALQALEFLAAGDLERGGYNENLVLTASGEERLIAWRNSLLRDEQGAIIGSLSSGENITARRQAEDALRASEIKYHALFDVFPLGITISDPTGQIIETNDTATQLLSAPKEVQNTRSIYGAGWSIIRPDGSPMPPEEFAGVRALQEGRPIENVEMGIVKGQGEVTWINVTATPLGLPGYGVVVTYHDISARKRAEQDYQTLFREMLDGFALHEIICDAEGRPVDYRFLAINPAFERLTGLKTHDVVGKTVLDVLPQTESYWIETYGQVALTGEPVVFESPSGALGKVFQVTTFSPKLGQFACIFADVTAQRQAQAELEESEEKFRLLVETSLVGVYIIQDGKMAYTSPACARIFGYEPHEIIDVLSPRELIHPDDIGTVMKRLSERLSGKRETGGITYRGLRKDGSVIRIEVYGVPISYRGRPAVMGTLLDVTEQVAMEAERERLREQLQAHAKELAQRVATRTRELAALFDIASVASKSMDLPAKLGHMLTHARTAMQAEAGAIHLLDREQPWGSAPEHGAALRLAVQQGCPYGLVAAPPDALPCSALALSALLRNELLVARGLEGAPCAPTLSSQADGSHAFAPVRAGGRVLGVLSVTRRAAGILFTPEDLALLTSIADQVGPVVESAWLQEQAQQHAVVQERERLSRELHDSVTQILYSLTLQADWAQSLCAAGDLPQCVERIATIGDLSHQVLRDMRLLMYELRPSMLEQDGLVGALERRLDAVERRAGLEVYYDVDLPDELLPSLELDLYRIAQEALNNVAKHSKAKTVAIELKSREGEVLLCITDDGVGFDPEEARQRGGLGLQGMRERVEQRGGKFEIVSEPGKGACVKATMGVH
jgi:PAS domain S-box-containing protein